MHFHGLLVRVRVSRLSKGKVEGNWFRRLFSRWTCFSVVTPAKAASENCEEREQSEPLNLSLLALFSEDQGLSLENKHWPVEELQFLKQNDRLV